MEVAEVRRRTAPAPRLKSPTSDGLRVVGILVIAGLAWEVLARLDIVDRLFFPPPSASLGALARTAVDGSLWPDLGATVRRFSIGLALGASTGTALGLAMGASRRIRAWADPLIAVVHPIPKISLFPLLLIVLGIGDGPKVAIVAIAAFFPMVINAMTGVLQIDGILHEVADVYGFSRRDKTRRVILPGAVPSLFAGLRLAANSAFVLAIAAEIVIADTGLGSRIWFAWETLRTDELYATLILIGIVGWTVQRSLGALHRRVAPWMEGIR